MINEAQHIMGGVQFKLTRPIKAHGEEVDELHLNRPTPAQCRRIGRMPYVVTNPETGAFSPDLSVISTYLSVCCAIPPSAVDQLELMDLNQLAWAVCSFFTTPESSASSS